MRSSAFVLVVSLGLLSLASSGFTGESISSIDKRGEETVPTNAAPAKRPAQNRETGKAPKADKPSRKSDDRPASDPKPDEKKADSKKPEVKKPEVKKVEPKKPEPKKADEKPGVEITPAREAAALTFARLHHPELADLLEQLKKGNPSEYERAIRDLYLTSDRIARVKEKTPDRYELALSGWKLDSRIRLLSARMVMSENPDLEAELKVLLEERHQVRVRELQHERDKVAARLQKLDSEIAALQADRDAQAKRELQQVRNHVSEKAGEFKGRQRKKDGASAVEPQSPAKDSKPDAATSPADSKPASTKTDEPKSKDDARPRGAKKDDAKRNVEAKPDSETRGAKPGTSAPKGSDQ